MSGNHEAPAGQIYVCGACGKTSRWRYGFDEKSRMRDPNSGERYASAGWDESCMCNAVLCWEKKGHAGRVAGGGRGPGRGREGWRVMGAYIHETLAELRSLLNDAREAGNSSSYGVCLGDPRDFTPDHECSTEAEREAHRVDCERADRGEPPLTRTACHGVVVPPDGLAIITPGGYGLGVNTIEDPAMQDIAERLERIEAELTRWVHDVEAGSDD